MFGWKLQMFCVSLEDAELGLWTCRRAHLLDSVLFRLIQLAFWLVETTRKRRREALSSLTLLLQPLFTITLFLFGLSRILTPFLNKLFRSCCGARTNPPASLQHFWKNQSYRKYRAEGIGVRMAAYKLVLIRHGESAWNQENRFCGWFDADLSEAGEKEAKRGGQALKGRVLRARSAGLMDSLSLNSVAGLSGAYVTGGWRNRQAGDSIKQFNCKHRGRISVSFISSFSPLFWRFV